MNMQLRNASLGALSFGLKADTYQPSSLRNASLGALSFGLKGRHISAQGNALGFGIPLRSRSPVKGDTKLIPKHTVRQIPLHVV